MCMLYTISISLGAVGRLRRRPMVKRLRATGAGWTAAGADAGGGADGEAGAAGAASIGGEERPMEHINI